MRSWPPAPKLPNSRLRTSLIAIRSIACETSSASAFSTAPMSVEMWPVTGSTTPAGFNRFGSKKSSDSGIVEPAGFDIGDRLAEIVCAPDVGLSKLWPNRNATVENSVAMLGFTLAL